MAKEELPTKPQVSLEAHKKQLELEARRRANAPQQPHEQVTMGEAVKSIVDHLINADDLKLLQITPIPRNVIFDIAYDVTQRAVLDTQRIALHIPLSKIFYETYLRAVRGADNMLLTGTLRLADSQINANIDTDGDSGRNL